MQLLGVLGTRSTDEGYVNEAAALAGDDCVIPEKARIAEEDPDFASIKTDLTDSRQTSCTSTATTASTAVDEAVEAHDTPSEQLVKLGHSILECARNLGNIEELSPEMLNRIVLQERCSQYLEDDAKEVSRAAVQQNVKDIATILVTPGHLHDIFDPSVEVQPLDPKRFKIKQLVAEAPRNRGKVFLMRDTLTGCDVICKVMPNWRVGDCHSDYVTKHPEETELPWQDISTTKFLNCIGYTYACTLLGVHRDEGRSLVVSTVANEGDLFTWCSNPERPVPGLEREKLVRPLVIQLLHGVKQLHDLSIVHQDLSLENIVVSTIEKQQDLLRVFIIDYGMATTQRFCSPGKGRGKKPYRGPETHMNVYDGFLSDAFALGVVIFCVLLNDYPWSCTKPDLDKCFQYTMKNGFRKYAQQRRMRNSTVALATVFSEPVMQLLEGLLSPDPNDRLTLGEICWHADDENSLRSSVWDMEWLHSNYVDP